MGQKKQDQGAGKGGKVVEALCFSNVWGSGG